MKFFYLQICSSFLGNMPRTLFSLPFTFFVMVFLSVLYSSRKRFAMLSHLHFQLYAQKGTSSLISEHFSLLFSFNTGRQHFKLSGALIMKLSWLLVQRTKDWWFGTCPGNQVGKFRLIDLVSCIWTSYCVLFFISMVRLSQLGCNFQILKV